MPACGNCMLPRLILPQLSEHCNIILQPNDVFMTTKPDFRKFLWGAGGAPLSVTRSARATSPQGARQEGCGNAAVPWLPLEGELRPAAASGRGRQGAITAAAPLAARKRSRAGNGKCGKAGRRLSSAARLRGCPALPGASPRPAGKPPAHKKRRTDCHASVRTGSQ